MTPISTMKRAGLAAVLAACLAGTAFAIPEPVKESFTPEVLERVRAQAERTRDVPMSELEDVEGMIEESENAPLALEDRMSRGVFYDDDATHYARGTTMILHVFINHAGGQWEYSERQEAGAKATLAKQYYLDNAPNNAWLHFDNEGTSVYYALFADVPWDLSDATELEGYVINAAVQDLGFGDGDGDGEYTDDLTLSYQGWNGGWNNVIACFELADVDGQAWASYARAYVKLYVDDTWNVWAHEWGHTFGACDEYAAGCNSCASICQSWYLNDQVPNGNCEDCAGLGTCLMKYNHENLCQWTPRNWAWRDDDGNGQLDRVLRVDMAAQTYDIWELYHNGWMIHTNTDWGMVAPQRWNSWSAIGVRNRGTADYDITVYADNNRFHPLASSTYTSSYVDFVVGDFNHNKQMEMHVGLDLYSGAGQYVLSYESGNGVLYPDGVDRSYSWDALNVVRTYDVPLFANETIQFVLDPSASLDMGMALYASNGDVYFSGRSGWESFSDVQTNGTNESFTFTAPDDDVYGLVVWANNEVDGDFSIQIGPPALVLPEEFPWVSGADLRLFSFQPDVPYWAVAAARPSGTNISLRLCGDSTFQDVLATSGAYTNVEFIAADYNPGFSTDYLRTWVQTGAGTHTTEWEQTDDLLLGFDASTLAPNDVAKVWDVWLRAGQAYMFRQYNEAGGAGLDGGIYIVSSADGDRYTQRSGADGGSNTHPPADGGEWFTYTPPASDYYGYVLIKNDTSSGAYSIGFGPRITLDSNVPETHPEELLWADVEIQPTTWNLTAVRTDPAATASVGMWTCDTYGIECWLTGAAATQEIQFLAVDAWGAGTGTGYLRYRRESGTGEMAISSDTIGRSLVFDDPAEVVAGQGVFVENEVAHIWNLTTTSDQTYPLDVSVVVVPEEPSADLAVYVLDADGGWYQTAQSAAGSADAAGPGGSEQVDVIFDARDVHAVVVANMSGTAGGYDIRISGPTSVGVTDTDGAGIAAVALKARSANPMRDRAVFDLLLPEASPVDVGVFDPAGRLVRSLARGSLSAGVHHVAWDGRDTFGRTTAAGVYLVRLAAGGEVKTAKVLRAN